MARRLDLTVTNGLSRSYRSTAGVGVSANSVLRGEKRRYVPNASHDPYDHAITKDSNRYDCAVNPCFHARLIWPRQASSFGLPRKRPPLMNIPLSQG
jgi:hypothetical protein